MKFRFKKGYGKHYIAKQSLKPGDIIDCDPDELGGAADKFEALESPPPPPEPKVGLRIVKRDDKGFDVVNEATDKPLNDAPLNKKEAKTLAGIAADQLEKNIEPETKTEGAEPGE